MMRDETVKLALAAAGEATERPISIAIVAMGGQGGGVLTGWIVQLAEAAGWVAQSTSVPGVAQRTGATIYYVEIMQARDGQRPILAQMPTPGDVDLVIASEFMEAGRSILRGIVTPDRTTLIASSHRSLAIAEKSAPGMGIAQDDPVNDAMGLVARRSIVFDMNALAVANGSVISSAMFGALAATSVLPFPPAAYHAVIGSDGKGVAASIKTFDAAYARVMAGAETPVGEPATPPPLPGPPPGGGPLRPVDELVRRVSTSFPREVADMALAGLAKVVDYQDLAYGEDYVAALTELHQLDRTLDGHDRDFAFSVNLAKYLANAMTYDDVVRVADLKTRRTRRERVADEIGIKAGQIFDTTEYMHPRLEELVGLMPVGMGRWLQQRTGLYSWLDRRISKGRRVRTYSVGWFMVLYVVGGLRGLRRASLRHAQEAKHRHDWLALAQQVSVNNYDLGVEVLKCQRLIKGYSDTHSRGKSKFAKVTGEIMRIAERSDAADWARRLRETAIRDGEGGDLDGLLKTIRSIT
ncbi:MAG: indolepyruvate oxidoreductase subunit beta family protein [Alteraurantiacibacter sp.]